MPPGLGQSDGSSRNRHAQQSVQLFSAVNAHSAVALLAGIYAQERRAGRNPFTKEGAFTNAVTSRRRLWIFSLSELISASISASGRGGGWPWKWRVSRVSQPIVVLAWSSRAGCGSPQASPYFASHCSLDWVSQMIPSMKPMMAGMTVQKKMR